MDATHSSQPNLVLKGGLVFNGSNEPAQQVDVRVRNGKVAEVGPDLAVAPEEQLVDCQGQWVMPGLLDIHTHVDLEVEIAPHLPEVVRHGTTTAVMSNCSLGIAYGHQRRDGADPITDCFARVENVPKHVLRKVGDVCTWTDSGEYLDHFEQLPLGPNVVPLIPHSMLRIEVMGLKGSIERDPTKAERQQMAALVEKGMQEGYAGFSTDGLPFHYLANQPNTRKKIPTQMATYSELKELTGIVRKHGRVWQATPPTDNPLVTARNFLLTSGRFYGRPLKVTATAAIDILTNKTIAKLGLVLTRILNSKLIGGHFRFQALSAPFKMWADGAICPIAEEIPEMRALNELDLEDHAGRQAILNDPAWIAAFRKMWFKGKAGFNLANLKRILNREDNVFHRRLDDMFFDEVPLAGWQGEPMQAAYDRLQRYQASSGAEGATSAEEAELFAGFPANCDEADFFLHLLRTWDLGLRWHTTFANRNPDTLKKLLFHPLTLPGFNDSGAHLNNLAFYDGNLRTLKIAQGDGLAQVANAVNRLTKLPAEFWNLNAGTIEVGAVADICVVNPEALQQWQPEQTYARVERPEFECKQVVNRPDGVVKYTIIAGQLAYADGEFTAAAGQQRMGRLMRTKDHPQELALAAA